MVQHDPQVALAVLDVSKAVSLSAMGSDVDDLHDFRSSSPHSASSQFLVPFHLLLIGSGSLVFALVPAVFGFVLHHQSLSYCIGLALPRGGTGRKDKANHHQKQNSSKKVPGVDVFHDPGFSLYQY